MWNRSFVQRYDQSFFKRETQLSIQPSMLPCCINRATFGVFREDPARTSREFSVTLQLSNSQSQPKTRRDTSDNSNSQKQRSHRRSYNNESAEKLLNIYSRPSWLAKLRCATPFYYLPPTPNTRHASTIYDRFWNCCFVIIRALITKYDCQDPFIFYIKANYSVS